MTKAQEWFRTIFVIKCADLFCKLILITLFQQQYLPPQQASESALRKLNNVNFSKHVFWTFFHKLYLIYILTEDPESVVIDSAAIEEAPATSPAPVEPVPTQVYSN